MSSPCFPSSQSHFAHVRKNWQPLVLGPELAIESKPGASTHTTVERVKPPRQVVKTRVCEREKIQRAKPRLNTNIVAKIEVLVRELLAIDGHSPRPVLLQKVSPLSRGRGHFKAEPRVKAW